MSSMISSDRQVAERRAPWQDILARLISNPDELLARLGLQSADLPIPEQVLRDFPLRVPESLLGRIRPGDPADPILLQVLPGVREGDDTPGYSVDPLSEAEFNPRPGLLHKYHGRALMLTAPHCAIHCRYCFRRHFPYDDNTPGRLQWQQSLDYLRQNTDVDEVIFSGGDPLAAGDRQLSWLSREIAAIPHVRRLRIHTRTPIVVPQRVCAELLDWLSASPLQKVMVIHSNHPNEINDEVASAMAAIRGAGVTLLNQSVLLAGINDDADVLAELSEKLFSANVLPYYVHMLDRVQGVAHFDVDEDRAEHIMSQLRNRLPGYLVPRLVREIPGEGSKTPLF